MEIPVVKIASSDALPGPIALHAANRLAEAGVIVLKDLLAAERVSALKTAYEAQCGDISHSATGPRITKVGDKRIMIALKLIEVFADSDIFANSVALSIAAPLLGNDLILGSYVAVTSSPGAEAQELHTDLEGLYDDPTFDCSVPPYSITLVIPLVGLNEVTGSTRFFPGTHRDPAAENTLDGIAPDLDPGDAILFDSRVRHGGMANLSEVPRPIVYCTYHRAWYRDVSNFRNKPPMLIDDATLENMSAEERGLVDWVRREGG